MLEYKVRVMTFPILMEPKIWIVYLFATTMKCYSYFETCLCCTADEFWWKILNNLVTRFDLSTQMKFQESVLNHRRAEYERLRAEREERMSHILQQRRQEREMKRKMLFYMKSEEERLQKLHEEEEARKREGTFWFSCFALVLDAWVICHILSER